ncbi:acyltransferase [Fibrobacter sp.]|uniref:acyltransferase n=1 Tax=Fibrobacter sp. TaxID=35828 RepID=UPI00386D5DDD
MFCKIKKVFFVLIRGAIKQIDAFSPRLYMKLYNVYLKKNGIVLDGAPRYIHPSVKFDGKGYKKTFLGKDVVISRDSLLLNHDYSIACGFRSIGENVEHEAYWLKEIRVGKNTFVGANVSILPGTIIGENCIIGTGAVIKGFIPDDSIVIGNPAKIVGHTQEWAQRKKEEKDYFFE